MSERSALEYAIKIIESYEMDIRNAPTTIGVDLIQHGFCQGRIYKEAIEKIKEATNE